MTAGSRSCLMQVNNKFPVDFAGARVTVSRLVQGVNWWKPLFDDLLSPAVFYPFIRTLDFSTISSSIFTANVTMSAEVEGILRSFWEWRLRESPEFATQNGVHIYDDKLDCHSLEAYAKRQVLHSLVVNFTWWYEGWNVQTTVVSLLCVHTLHVPRPMDWTNRLLIEVVSIIFF